MHHKYIFLALFLTIKMLLVSASAIAQMKPCIASPCIIAHRGASGTAPENTLAAIERGLSLGTDMIEIDVHLSKDGRVVVIHDKTLDRTTNGTGPVGEKTWNEMKGLDAGKWFDEKFTGQRLPLLEDVLALINGQRVLLLEIKKGDKRYPGLVQKTVEILNRFKAADWVIVQSFEEETVAEMLKTAPAYETHWLTVGAMTGKRKLKRVADRNPGLKAINMNYRFTNEKKVKFLHSIGLKTFTWTVNDLPTMEKLSKIGVDGIITNFPELLTEK